MTENYKICLFIFVFISLEVLVSNFGAAGQDREKKKLPCRLAWIKTNGGQGIPAGAVKSTGFGDDVQNNDYIVRALFDNSTYLIGRYRSGLEEAVFPYDDELELATGLSSFEMLANIHGCQLSWTATLPEMKYRVPSDDNSWSNNGNIIGRVLIDGDTWIGGEVNLTTRSVLIAITSCYEKETISDEHEYLHSYSKGLELELTDFEFDESLFGGELDLVGEDIVENNANTYVNQTVFHRKMIRETTNFTVSETWTSTYTETVKSGFLFWKKKKTTTHTVSTTKIKSIVTVEETDVSVTREILVPPGISVRACSVISMKNDFTTGYSAKAKYSGAGLTPQEILVLLAEDNIRDGYIENEYVVIDVRGTFSGSLALSTSFIVAPLDDPQGCQTVKKNIAQRKIEKIPV